MVEREEKRERWNGRNTLNWPDRLLLIQKIKMEKIRNIDACRMVKQHITNSNYKKKGKKVRKKDRDRESNKVKTISYKQTRH